MSLRYHAEIENSAKAPSDITNSITKTDKIKISSFLNSQIKTLKELSKSSSKENEIHRYKAFHEKGSENNDSPYTRRKLLSSPSEDKFVLNKKDENILDLISSEVNGGNLLNFYKEKEKTSPSPPKFLEISNIDDKNKENRKLGISGLKLCQRKKQLYKHKSAQLIGEWMFIILKDYYQTFFNHLSMRLIESSKNKKIFINLSQIRESSFDSKLSHLTPSELNRRFEMQERRKSKEIVLPANMSEINGNENSHPTSYLNTPFELASELNDIQPHTKNKIVSKESISYLQQANYDRKPLSDVNQNARAEHKRGNTRTSYLDQLNTPTNKIAGAITPSFVMSPFATSFDPRNELVEKDSHDHQRRPTIEYKPPIKNGGPFRDTMIIRIVHSSKNDVPSNLRRGRAFEPHARAKPIIHAHQEEPLNTKDKAHRRLKSQTRILSETHDKSLFSESTTSFVKTPFRLSFIRSNDVSVIDDKTGGTGYTTPVERKARENGLSLAAKMKALQEELFRDDSSERKNDEAKISRIMQIAQSLRKTNTHDHQQTQSSKLPTYNTESSADRDTNRPSKSLFRLQHIESQKHLSCNETYTRSTTLSLADFHEHGKLSTHRGSSLDTSKGIKLSFADRLSLLRHSLDIFQRLVSNTLKEFFDNIRAYSDKRQSPMKTKYKEMKTMQPANPVFSSFSTPIQSHNIFPVTPHEKVQGNDSPQFSSRRKYNNSKTDLHRHISPQDFYEKIPNILFLESLIMKLLRVRYRAAIDILKFGKAERRALVPSLKLNQNTSSATNKHLEISQKVISKYSPDVSTIENNNSSLKLSRDNTLSGSFNLGKTYQAESKVSTPTKTVGNQFPSNTQSLEDLTQVPTQTLKTALSRQRTPPESSKNTGRKSIPSGYSTPNKFRRSSEMEEIIRTGQQLAEKYLSSHKKEIVSGGNTERSKGLSQKSLLNSPISIEEINKSFQEEKKQVIEFFDKFNTNFSKNLQFFVALDKLLRKRFKDQVWEAFTLLKQDQQGALQNSPSPVFTFRNKNKSKTPQRVSIPLNQSVQRRLVLSAMRNDELETEAKETSFIAPKEIVNAVLSLYLVLDKIIKGRRRTALRIVKTFAEEAEKQRTFKKSISINTVQKTFMLSRILEGLVHRVYRFAFKNIEDYSAKKDNKENELKVMVFLSKCQGPYLNRIRQFWMKLNQYAMEHRLHQSSSSKYLALSRYSEGLEKIRSYTQKCNKQVVHYAINKLNRFRIRDKNMTLYVVGLVHALKEIRKSRVKYFFFHLKQNSQALFYKRVEKITVLTRIVSKKTLQEQVIKRKAYTKWKDFSIATSRRIERRNKDVLLFVRCLNNLYKANHKIMCYSAFFQLRHFAKDKKRAFTLFKALSNYILNRKSHVLDTLKEVKQIKVKKQMVQQGLAKVGEIFLSRIKKSFLTLVIQSQIANSSMIQIKLSKNISRVIAALENYRRSNLEKGLKMIELEFISKRNREKLYINLGLKVIFLVKKKREQYKREFLDYLAYNSERNDEINRLLEKIIHRNYMKNLAHFFNRFRNELTNIKINRSMIDTAIKSLKLSIEKLDRLQREAKSYFFRKLFLYSKGMTLSFIDGNRIPTGSEANHTTQIDFICQSTNRNELHRKVIEFMTQIERIFLRRKAQGLKAIQAKISQNREKLKKRVEYVEANILKKLFFKRKFLCFSHIKYVAQKLKEKKTLDRMNAAKKLLEFWKKKSSQRLNKSLQKWRKCVEEENQRVLQQSKNIAMLRLRKCFTDWRLAYIKKNNQKNKFKSGATKFLNALKKLITPKLADTFQAIKKYEKRSVYKLIYIPIDKEDRIIEIETPNVVITQPTNQSIDTPQMSISSDVSMLMRNRSKKSLQASTSFAKNQLSLSQSITPSREKNCKSPLPKSPNVKGENSSQKKKTLTLVSTSVSSFAPKKK